MSVEIEFSWRKYSPGETRSLVNTNLSDFPNFFREKKSPFLREMIIQLHNPQLRLDNTKKISRYESIINFEKKKRNSVTSEQFLSSSFSLVASRQTDFVEASENRNGERFKRIVEKRREKSGGRKGARRRSGRMPSNWTRELSITGVFRDEKLHRERKTGVDKGLAG